MNRFPWWTTGVFLMISTALTSLRAEYVPQVYTNAEGHTLKYQIHVPEERTPRQAIPLVLFLHGAGERGQDNQKQLKHAAPDLLAYSLAHEPAIILVPQCPKRQQWVEVAWTNETHIMPPAPSRPLSLAMELLQHVRREQLVDDTRIYVAGISMGGFGTWDLLQRNPRMFAAAIPVCGGGDPAFAQTLKKIPIWVFHGALDEIVDPNRSREMVKALEEVGGHIKYTEYPDAKHDAWTATFSNDEVLKWLFDQRREP